MEGVARMSSLLIGTGFGFIVFVVVLIRIRKAKVTAPPVIEGEQKGEEVDGRFRRR